MNILLINPVHPSTPHISAVRAGRFGDELAKLGHRVVLLCAAAEGDASLPGDQVRTHDWTRPYVLATEATSSSAGSPGRGALLRRIETMSRMVMVGGYQASWVRSAVNAMVPRAGDFRPDVIWATFGKMEAVVAARRLAHRLKVPWVLDLKDDWELYVPRGLRRVMALRTRGWVALTANSELIRDRARIWQRDEATVVYSGVDDVFFERDHPTPNDTFTINLIGGLYFADRVLGLLDGIGRWVDRLTAADRVRVQVCYLGGDLARFETCVATSRRGFEARAMGYLPTGQMASACRRAAVNAYVVHDSGFHHKLLELLACGRPLIAYPAERAESRRLAAEVQGELLEPADPESVAQALDAVHQRWEARRHSSHNRSPERYSWPAQTRMLERVLAHVARD
jgi:glycosyltransferase involved in cell wall biosynthesis